LSGSEAELDAMLGAEWRDAVDRRRAEINDRIGGRTNVVLFGSGDLGRYVRRDLANLPYRALAYVDNNPARWETEVDGLEILSPEGALARFGSDVLWLITIYTNSRVIAQCEALGVPWITCAELSWSLPEPHPPSFMFGTPERLADASQAIEKAGSIWADAGSEAEYQAQVRWRFLLDYDALRTPDAMSELYFPGDLIRPIKDEVFVDCGAFTGDTIDAFVAARGGQFDQIIAVEPDLMNCAALRQRVGDWSGRQRDRVRIVPAAVGSSRGIGHFEMTGTVTSKIASGGQAVEVAPLDEILADSKPTYIKFDVEGAERDALIGGEETISANMPVLAVCLYHRPEDLWDLPLLVQSLAPDYRLYLRRYSDERWETVLYAVPPERALG
jgi:FkbM family methyltransferase